MVGGNFSPWAKQELWVLGGQVVLTVKLHIQIAAEALQDPIGKNAAYTCELQGFSRSSQSWSEFDANHPVAAFRLTPTPAVLHGTFVW